MGGLRDTVTPFDPHSSAGTGWTFDWADAGAFRGALGNALYTYRDYRHEFEGVQQRGMAQARPALCPCMSLASVAQAVHGGSRAGAEQGRQLMQAIPGHCQAPWYLASHYRKPVSAIKA